MAAQNQRLPLVFDNGSALFKAGFAGEEEPKVIFPSIVGKPRHANLKEFQEALAKMKKHYVGHEAVQKRGILCLRYPIEGGVINKWEDMEALWQHAFDNELQVKPEEHPILLTESPMNTKENRTKILEIMFEKFKSPSVFMANPAVMSLYASGQTNGLVVDIGAGAAHIVPVHKGYAVSDATQHFDVCGRELTDYMMKILIERDIEFCNAGDWRTARAIKEQLGYVALDYDRELQSDEAEIKKTYELLNEETVTVGKERFRAAEPLFQPSLLEKGHPGLHQAIWDTVQRCDESIRSAVFSNVVLAGGSTLFPGIKERLEKEIKQITSATFKIRAPEHRATSAWIGGSIFACNDAFLGMSITREKYEETGSS
ncbi:actin, plasmodial isoform-like [Diadema antillarum]|uniref:actin, plasmodial isoform-like n=1 Tax=Diadema antillarum TaxID=105358 RepID=UPI003A85F380